MLTDFISKKLKKAKYKLLEDGQYFGDIPGIRGVWAVHKNLQACKKELQEVFEEWLILQIADGIKIPGFPVTFYRPYRKENKKEIKAYA